MIKKAFTFEDFIFCQKLFNNKWHLKGTYYPIGPLVIMNETHSLDKDIIVSINDIIKHEFLHHRHLMSSSIGLLELYFMKATINAHCQLVCNNASLSFKQPYIERLSDEGIEKTNTKAILLSILYIFHLRQVFSGYKRSAQKQRYFLGTVSEVADVFNIIYNLTFPDAMKIFDNLKGIFADTISAAPEYYMEWFVGSSHILEGFAVNILGGISGSLWRENLEWLKEITLEEVMNDDFARFKYGGLSCLLYRGFLDDYLLSGKAGHLVGTHVAFNELAMNPAILPSQLRLWKRKPLWYDLHPGYRFYDLCRSIETIGSCPHFLGDPSQIDDQVVEYMDRAAEYLEWPSYTETINSLCELEISDKFDRTFMGKGVSQVKILAKMKKENFIRYLFGLTSSEADYAPIAILNSNTNKYYVSKNSESLISLLYPTIMSALLNEFYFSDSLDFTATLLSPLNDKELTEVADSLEVNTHIEGVRDAIIKQVQIVQKSQKYKHM